MKKGFILFLLVLIIGINSSAAQTKNYPEYPHQAANISLIDDFMNEVYADMDIYKTSEHKNLCLKKLERTIIHTVPFGEYPECPLLSTLPLKNKYNPNLQSDLNNFDTSKFNPLKYGFNYTSTSTTYYYRVDNSNYIIEIKPNK